MSSSLPAGSQPPGLAASIRPLIERAIFDIYPLWEACAQIDIKRVVRPVGPGQFSYTLEPYHGRESWWAFRKTIEDRESLKKLEATILAVQPELLGVVVTPTMSMKIQSVLSLISVWCIYADGSIRSGSALATAANDICEALDAILSGKPLTHTVRTLLSGLTLVEGVDEIRLAPHVAIRRLTSEMLTEISSHDAVSDQPTDVVQLLISTALFITGKEPFRLFAAFPQVSPRYSLVQQMTDEVDTVVTALHLAKPGRVGQVKVTYEFTPPVLPGMNGLALLYQPIPFSSMEFSATDIERIHTLYDALRASNESKIRIAAARLRDAEHRSSPVDALLDAAIGLEVLLNPVDHGELAFRSAVNFAYLADLDERRKRYEDLQVVQKMRNDIVHGGLNMRSGGAEKISGVSSLGKDCLRDALIHFLTNPALRGKKIDRNFWLDRLMQPPGPFDTTVVGGK